MHGTDLAPPLPTFPIQVSNLESMVGAPPTVPPIRTAKSKAKNGIDVVLGAQWGDEGKGKLVDLLSQVRCPCRLYAYTRT